MKNTEQEQQIKERFISKFTVWNNRYKYATLKGVEEYPTPDDIADWWLSLRSQELQELVEEIEGMKKEEIPFTERLGTENKKTRQMLGEFCYNQALDQVLQTIKARMKQNYS